MAVRKPSAELKAYIHWQNRWRHVYIISSFDQQTLLGEPVRMLQFKLTKASKETFTSEKINFHKKKPTRSSMKKGVAA